MCKYYNDCNNIIWQQNFLKKMFIECDEVLLEVWHIAKYKNIKKKLLYTSAVSGLNDSGGHETQNKSDMICSSYD